MEGRATPEASSDLPPLRGRRVLLRQPVPADVVARTEVPSDPEEHRMYGGSGTPEPFTEDRAISRLAGYARQDLSQTREFVIAALVWPDGRSVGHAEGRYVGGIRLHSLSWSDRKARLALGLFDRRFWSHGYGTQAIQLLLRYGFEELGLHRIDLRVLDYNVRAIRAYQKCGFVREGSSANRRSLTATGTTMCSWACWSTSIARSHGSRGTRPTDRGLKCERVP
jgi:RimJ/RimL family protein N-acetyltransferase